MSKNEQQAVRLEARAQLNRHYATAYKPDELNYQCLIAEAETFEAGAAALRKVEALKQDLAAAEMLNAEAVRGAELVNAELAELRADVQRLERERDALAVELGKYRHVADNPELYRVIHESLKNDNLRAEVQRLERERDEALDQIDQMGQDRTAWDKDCAKELNRLAILTGFEFEDPDGYAAEVYGEHIESTLEQYKSQRDAALRDVATLREALEGIASGAEVDLSGVDGCKGVSVCCYCGFVPHEKDCPKAFADDALANTAAAAEEYERRIREPLERRVQELEAWQELAGWLRCNIDPAWSDDAPIFVALRYGQQLAMGTLKNLRDMMATTPAAALDAVKREAAAEALERAKGRLYALASKEQDQPYGYDMNPRQWAATCLECAAEDISAMQEELRAEEFRAGEVSGE